MARRAHRHLLRMAENDPLAHWQSVYGAKAPEDVSWHQARPHRSLALIEAFAPDLDAMLIDVGGGASTLVDHLLAQGKRSLVVLDLAHAALVHAQTRLGDKADKVYWIAADITRWRSDIAADIWHDRAVLHFLTEPADQHAYANTLRATLKRGGVAIVAGFAPGGPLMCSGRDIVQHDAASLKALLGAGFELLHVEDESHRTPWGAEQAFRYHVWRRVG